MGQIGNITVPSIAASGTFPIEVDFPTGLVQEANIVVHRFGSRESRTEQRFYLGDGARRLTVGRRVMTPATRKLLADFWDARKGAYQPFTFNAWNPDKTQTAYTVRFADPTLTLDALSSYLHSAQLELVVVPSSFPSYTITTTTTRFPSSALQTALLDQAQTIIPLIKVVPMQAGYPAIYMSDRTVTVGGQVYEPRLIEWDGIQQSMGADSDEARFSFGNADRVMRDLANDVDLFRASIEFSLFVVNGTAGTKLDLWKGDIVNWSFDSGPLFQVTAADGLYELNLPYPPRRITRTCMKPFDDDSSCPYATAGANDTTNFPLVNSLSCDKGYETANGCLAHGMQRYFGGVLVEPQGVRIKDNSTGTWGFGRSPLTSVSSVESSIYDEVLQEIYTDIPMPVNCKLAVGRDESEFYSALGIVGEGPLVFGTGHTLDNQKHHGAPGLLGLGTISGTDPAGATDFFSLSQSGNQTAGDFRKVYSGTSTYLNNFAAGTAALAIRRTDTRGILPTPLTEHSMVAVITGGLRGWVWTEPGVRSEQQLTNGVWVLINMLLRARGMRNADVETAESIFDVEAAIAAAAVCSETVTSLIGAGTETQFKFLGVIREQKPLRDWMAEVLMNFLGFATFCFGKLKIGVRVNSSVVAAGTFSQGNILFNSLSLSPKRPSFNHITAHFADTEFDFVSNTVSLYDIDHANLIGSAGGGPLFLKSSMNLVGATTKSQVARIVSVRLREELGGVTASEWKKARRVSFDTTVLALATEPGMVCSMTHPDMPDGSGEFRVEGWRLNRDYSISIHGSTTTDSMYDLIAGPKPADVLALPVPMGVYTGPLRPVWHPDTEVPVADDPLYPEDRHTFLLTQTYRERPDTTRQLILEVRGKFPVNTFLPDAAATVVRTITKVNTGGSLTGDSNLFVSVCPFDADGFYGPPSNVMSAALGTGNTWTVSLTDIEWPAGTWVGYIVGASSLENNLTVQSSVEGDLPDTITLTDTLLRSTWTFPNHNFRGVRLKAKRVLHAGVLGVTVSSVAAGSVVCSDLAGLGDDWTDRVLSVVTDKSDGTANLWNFPITSYDDATGTFTCSIDPEAAGVEAGDVATVSTKVSSATARTITDTGWTNGVYPGGMTVSEEEGRLVRIIAGTGRGQVRRIVSNTSEEITVDADWTVIPDTDTVFIVEAPGWEYHSETTRVDNSRADTVSRFDMIADNFAEQTLLVMGVGVDTTNGEAPEDDDLSPWRLTYIYGHQGGVLLTNEMVISHA